MAGMLRCGLTSITVYGEQSQQPMDKIKWPGLAQLVARVVWEQEARVRAAALGKPGSPWDTRNNSSFPLAGNWPKIGVDHMFDHN